MGLKKELAKTQFLFLWAISPIQEVNMVKFNRNDMQQVVLLHLALIVGGLIANVYLLISG